MLTKVVEHLNSFGIIPMIKDDGSSYEPKLPQYFRHKHRGKKEYWITWYEMLNSCVNSEAELFLFMPDDFQELQVERMLEIHEQLKSKPYVYNIINDGRRKMWTKVAPLQINENEFRVGFTDCGFFCNREALQSIKFRVDQVPDWFWKKHGEEASSGVGYQLSVKFCNSRVPIYLPIKSLAKHGDHDSRMHPDERKKNPLISK